jgi:hypothetical protein
MLWYVSKGKVEVLAEMLKTRSVIFKWLAPKSLVVKLKSPYAEAEGKWEGSEESTIDTLRRLCKKANRRFALKSFDMVTEKEHPVLILFKGPAARAVEDHAFWIATHNGLTTQSGHISQALLLTGSAANIVGGAADETRHISASVDPIKAAERAFLDGEGYGDTPEILSYAWQTVWLPMRKAVALPFVWGVAVFAAKFPAVVSDFKMLGFSDVTHLTIASPVFVQEIESHETLPVEL